MKINILILFLTAFNCFGQEYYTTTTSKIKEVKIYSSGGMLKQSFSAQLLPGKNFIIVNEFGRNRGLDMSSFKPDKKILLLRFDSYGNNANLYADKMGRSPKLQALNDSIEIYRKDNKNFEQELLLTRNSIGIIQKNQELQIPSSAEILKMIEFNKTSLKNLYLEEQTIQAKIAANQAKVSALENKRSAASREYGLNSDNTIVLLVNSDKKQTVNFDVNQYIPEVNWRPYYIIKSNGIKSPLKISYKAKIQQNTGLEFKNIPIKLINGSFSADDKPYELDRWFLRTDRDHYVSNQAFQRPKSGSNVKAYIAAEVSDNPRISQRTMKTEISLSKDAIIPSDVEITEDLSEFEVNTTYAYFSTPKLENKTFLLASIKDYSKYNFLPGNADIFMEDLQIGTVSIDTNQLTSEMMISLGSDPNILTKRELIKKETRYLGNNEKLEAYLYEIAIKNNKDTTVKLELKDQIPLSTGENIKIEVVNPDKAAYDKDSGFLIWNLEIKPNETKKIKFGFNVTLPEELVTLDIK